jgi:hypothetical protein
MIRWGIPNLEYPTAALWKSQVIDQYMPATPVTLVYPTDTHRQRAQGNIRGAAQLYNLFAEVFAQELPYLATRSIQDINNTLLGKTFFHYAYPDSLIENINPAPAAQPKPQIDNYVTYRMREPNSLLQGLTGPTVQGNHEQRPRQREIVTDAEGNQYEIQGQRHTYEVHLEIWSPDNTKADYLCDWVEDIMAMYGGWIISKGVQDLIYGWRDIPSPDLINRPTSRLCHRELVYLVVLDRHYVLRKQSINQISIGREVQSNS